MVRLNFSEKSLTSRIEAAENYASAMDLLRQSDGDIVLDLGANLATTSWVDGFVAPLVREFGTRVSIVCTSGTTFHHLARVLRSRSLQTRVAESVADVTEGRSVFLPAG